MKSGNDLIFWMIRKGIGFTSGIDPLEIEEPYLEADGATTYELGACYNVTVECKVKDALFFHTDG